ncbi:type II toxin-antitoxin system VapC family toxin [Hugenholtzia roseola]|uniref:type II toxin-antitoxin system VapC family toxin n=1 Tax=Hugenholtzia roseola TaxID=1002 RepID=UPI0004792C0B|nr:type II toxin-antitoxin system VapC family toxin [Hugenholtzia roseola]
MQFILDTNVVILAIKNSAFSRYFDETYLHDSTKTFYLSVVSVGEIASIARQNKWGSQKLKDLSLFLNKMIILSLDKRTYVDAYAFVETYSQGKLEGLPLPAGLTPRNMGKNDLWIAAFAKVLGATLITTDKDFNHLQPHIISVDYIEVQNFK